MKPVKKNQADMAIQGANWLYLNVFSDWKFSNLRQPVANVVVTPLRTLLVNSDVVRGNIVGDTKHPLVQEVAYKHDGLSSTYFEPLHMQWMPVRCPFLDVIEVQLAKSNGELV